MDEKLTILLVEDDPQICKELIVEISKDAESFNLVGVTNNSGRALQYVCDTHPDAVLLDLELSEGSEGIEFLKRLKSVEISRPPFVLVTTNNISTLTHKVAREYGADFIMTKNQEGYSAQSVVDFIKIARTVIISRPKRETLTGGQESDELAERRIQRRISHELDKVGISAKSVGYRYLIDAIMIIMKKPVQHVCRIIGAKYNKTENSVERAMQNAINRAWANSDINDLLANYTARIKSSKGIPTITEFIFFYAQKLNNVYPSRAECRSSGCTVSQRTNAGILSPSCSFSA